MTQHKSNNPVLKGFVLPGLVQPLLTPDANPGYRKVRAAFDKVREEIEQSNADVILIYSTMWPSILGHQIQAMPEPEWVLVDEEFHELGTIPYKLKIDSSFAECYNRHAKLRGLHSRTIAYHGFPIDSGSVVALKLINPNNRIPAVIVSSNIYADRAETVVLAKAAVSALKEQGKRAIAVIISTLSNRLHSDFIDPKDDKIHSLKDQEWNLKILEFLEKGRLEDVAQLSRQIQREARVKKVTNFKPFWWLSSVMGSHNRYTGQIYEYQPIYGTGCAVVGLTPALQASRDLEFDEDAPDYYTGERNVLSASGEAAADFSAMSNLYNNLDGEQAKPKQRRVTMKISDVYPKSPFGEKIPGIPTGRDVEWQPLIDYRRNGVSENTIHGAIAWYSGEELIHSFGGNVLCYGRSMMKLFYMKVFANELANQTSWEQKAISVSSHNGAAEHIEAAQSLLAESEWGLMQTPLDLPLVQFGRQVRRPRRWYNNSSGHHAAILLGCRLKGWNRAGYTLPNHEVYESYLKVVQQYLGQTWSPLRVARDGDGLPTVAMTVNELAKCYAGLSKNRSEDWIWESMIRHPDLVGGFNRLDTTIMKSCKGEVIAKEGADGLLGMAISHPEYPQGLGVVIKIAHGWNPQATWYIARGILGSLGFELRNPYPLRRQKAFLVPQIAPEKYFSRLESIPTWDEWDPDHDRWYMGESKGDLNG